MKSLPRNITLHLTENCNLRCKMCYFWGDSGTYVRNHSKYQTKTLNFAIIKELINDLSIVKPNYSLFGGEPLLYPQFKELIEIIKRKGSFIDTPTNGTLIAEKAEMLVNVKFDSIRVSLDGPKKINDKQRGKGSYERAMKGIEILHTEKQYQRSKKPEIGIIYTVTPSNYNGIEDFFLENLDLEQIDWVTIQMQNFITKEMGRNYEKLLFSEFGIKSSNFWTGLVRSIDEFEGIDAQELSRQVNTVSRKLKKKGKNLILLPPTFSPKNLRAYLNAKWTDMEDQYKACFSPFVSLDVVANGDVAPCHIFYDLVMGNLYEDSIIEIWNNPSYLKFRNFMKKQVFMSICYGCCILYLSGKKKRKSMKT